MPFIDQTRIAMRSLAMAIAVVLLFAIPAIVAQDCKVYVVAPGDYCDKIARENRISVADLVRFNNNLNCNALSVGQKLCTSLGSIPLPSANGDGTCRVTKVESGQWCDLIARNHGLTIIELQTLNPGLNCGGLNVGQRLCVSRGRLPPPPMPPANSDGTCRTATVTPGTWCDKIATDNGLEPSQFPQLNPGLDCSKLQIGQRLCISQGRLPPPPVPDGNADGTCKEYKVVSGDECWNLHEKCKLTKESFDVINPGFNCGNLKSGKRICCSKGTLKSNRPSPLPNGECFHVKLPKDGTCDFLSSEYDVTVEEIERWNTLKTWRWAGCGKLIPELKICLSEGRSPNPDPLPADKVQCGGETEGDKQCPLNACCSKWGWCGVNEEFCRAEPTLAPGLGCQSNCDIRPPASAYQCDGAMRYSIGYYESWAETRACMKFRPEDINPYAYTHIHYAFGVVDANLRINVPSDFERNQLRRLKKHFRDTGSKTKVVLSLGGWAFNNKGSGTEYRFSDAASKPSTRQAFAESAVNFLREFELDGLDLDWEYPRTPERSGRDGDTENYLELVRTIRSVFRQNGAPYTLSIAAPASYWYLREFKIADMSRELDYIVYMTYDLHGNWDYHIPTLGGHMLSHTNLTEIYDSMDLIMKAGVPSNKILMGIGFYGRSFKQANPGCSTPGCPFVNPGHVDSKIDNYVVTAQPGPCTNAGGVLAYGEINTMIKNNYYHEVWRDLPSMSNIMIYGADNWVAFDSPWSLVERVKYARGACLGGIVVWAIDLDSEDSQLTNTLAEMRGLRHLDMQFLGEFLGQWKTVDYMTPDNFFTSIANEVGKVATARRFNTGLTLQLMLHGHIAMLEELIAATRRMFLDSELANSRGDLNRQILGVMAGPGNSLCTCSNGVRNVPCPTSMFDPEPEDTIIWNCNEGEMRGLISKTIGISDLIEKRDETVTIYRPCDLPRNGNILTLSPERATNPATTMDRKRDGRRAQLSLSPSSPLSSLAKARLSSQEKGVELRKRRICTFRANWKGIFKLVGTARTNYFHIDGYQKFVDHTIDSLNDQLKEWQLNNADQYFTCGNEACSAAIATSIGNQVISARARDENQLKAIIEKDFGIPRDVLDRQLRFDINVRIDASQIDCPPPPRGPNNPSSVRPNSTLESIPRDTHELASSSSVASNDAAELHARQTNRRCSDKAIFRGLGLLVATGNWPPHPRPLADDFLNKARVALADLTKVAETSMPSWESLQDSITIAIGLLATGDETNASIKQYIKAVEAKMTEEDQRRDALKAVFSAILNFAVGTALSMVIPGAIFAGAGAVFNALRASTAVSRLAGAVSNAGRVIGGSTTVLRVGASLRSIAGMLPPSVVNAANRARQAFTSFVNGPLRCAAKMAAETGVDEVVSKAIPTVVLKRSIQVFDVGDVFDTSKSLYSPFDTVPLVRRDAYPCIYRIGSTKQLRTSDVRDTCKTNPAIASQPILLTTGEELTFAQLEAAGYPSDSVSCDHLLELQEVKKFLIMPMQSSVQAGSPAETALCNQWRSDPDRYQRLVARLNSPENLRFADEEVNTQKELMVANRGTHKRPENNPGLYDALNEYMIEVRDARTATANEVADEFALFWRQIEQSPDPNVRALAAHKPAGFDAYIDAFRDRGRADFAFWRSNPPVSQPRSTGDPTTNVDSDDDFHPDSDGDGDNDDSRRNNPHRRSKRPPIVISDTEDEDREPSPKRSRRDGPRPVQNNAMPEPGDRAVC